MLATTGVSTPAHWLDLARGLTDALAANDDLTDRDDCIVQILDEEGCENRPIAWHVPMSSDIVLNARLIRGMRDLVKLDRLQLQSLIEEHIVRPSIVSGSVTDLITPDERLSYYHRRDGGYRTNEQRKQILTMLRIRGVLAHEAAHSKWSHWLLESWVPKVKPELFKVMMQLEEVRIESFQIAHRDELRKSMRLSARMIMPTREDLEKTRTDSGKISVPGLAFNSILTLGRADRGVLNGYEVENLRNLLEDVVGSDRLQIMSAIWNDFAVIETGGEQLEMIPLAQEWLELFGGHTGGEKAKNMMAIIVAAGSGASGKKDEDEDGDEDGDADGLEGDSSRPATGDEGEQKDGSSSSGEEHAEGSSSAGSDEYSEDEETLDADGLLDALAEAIKESAEEASKDASAEKSDKRPNEISDARDTAKSVFKRHGEGYSRGKSGRRERMPRPDERAAAMAFAKRLERLSVRARSQTSIRSLQPPGRLKTRSAVAQAADRAQGRASTAQPWQRTVRKHNDTPKLTVGIMTDISGSMGWAEDFVASTSWTCSKAVRHINGTVAAVVFGNRAEPVLGPSDRLEKVTVRSADGGSEAFDEAIAALDGMLRLSDTANGVRILIVISDGMFVRAGEMNRQKIWAERMAKAGVVLIWITDSSSDYEYGGVRVVPKTAHVVQVEASYGRSSKIDMSKLVQKVADEITKAFAGSSR